MKAINRRDFLTRMTVSAAAAASPGLASNRPPDTVTARKRGDARGESGKLLPPAFTPLPLGSVRPRGWLLNQLRLQAAGLSGHLDEFWPDVGQSRWFGGDAEGWERAPYWLDGVIPLAWLLDDRPLKDRITRYLDYILTHQRKDGWYGTHDVDIENPDHSKPYDIWAFFLANKMLTQYHEVSGDARALEAIRLNLKMMVGFLDRQPLFNWGRFRWFEGLIGLFYLYERSGESWLLDLAGTLHGQGFDYRSFYKGQDVTVPTPRRGLWKWDKHVVNTGMAAKAYALWRRVSGEDRDKQFIYDMLEILDRHHGQVNGMFTGDECLAGKNPVQGTELCAVVEFMYSLELLLSLLGDPRLGDRLEKVAFNALPATFSPDMWAHQYDQQVNQVQATINPDHMWTTNGPESNIYGLEPNYGCCTSNMHQGWPKFAAHLWMTVPEGGLAAVAYAPSEVRFESGGVPVAVTLDTDYPFKAEMRLTVTAERPVRFPLLLRIPAWTKGATVRVEGRETGPLNPETFQRIEREWQGTSGIEIRFPMTVRTSRRYNEALSLERGPLVYALRIGEEWKRVNEDKPHRELPHGDWEVHAATPWNYGLVIDEAHPDEHLTFAEKPVGDRPFSPEGAPMEARVPGRRLPEWKLRHGWADEIRPGLQESREPDEELILVPYGCTNIRVGEFPRLKK